MYVQTADGIKRVKIGIRLIFTGRALLHFQHSPRRGLINNSRVYEDIIYQFASTMKAQETLHVS